LKKFLLIVSIVVSTIHAEAQTKSPVTSVNAQTTIMRSYPNPASSVITFDFQKGYDKGFSIQIYNFLGRKMLEQTNLADRTTINLTDFTRGVYVYQLRDKTGKLVESGKFQVSK
jgi:hypothetical protein